MERIYIRTRSDSIAVGWPENAVLAIAGALLALAITGIIGWSVSHFDVDLQGGLQAQTKGGEINVSYAGD